MRLGSSAGIHFHSAVIDVLLEMARFDFDGLIWNFVIRGHGEQVFMSGVPSLFVIGSAIVGRSAFVFSIQGFVDQFVFFTLETHILKTYILLIASSRIFSNLIFTSFSPISSSWNVFGAR